MRVTKLLVDEVSKVALRAADIVMGYWDAPLTFYYKDQAGFATQADIKTEKFIMSELSKIDSTISFLAEEGGKIDGASEWCWVIDPLDGTTNFAKQVPYFCISIALTYKQEPQLGVIYAPLAKELFVAFKGGGSFLNGASIHVSDAELKDSLIAVSFPYSCSQNFMDDLHNVQKVLSYVAGVRVMGAAALDLAGVAAGRFDGAFFHGLRWWDIAAGMVLLQESGAKIANFEGGAIDPNFNSFVAATPKIFKHLHDILNK